MSQGVFFDTYPVFSDERTEWQITDGTTPYVTTITLPKAIAEEIYASQISSARSSQPYKALQFLPSPGEPITFENLFVIGIEPYYDFRYLSLIVADNRYFWNRVHFKGSFNVRTKLGNKFVVDTASVAGLGDVPKILEDEIGYRSWSLKPSVRADATTVQTKVSITDIIKKILDKLKNTKEAPVLVYDSESPALNEFKNFFIEDIWLDSDCASCLRQVLSYVPQLGIFPDEQGIIRFFNRYNGSEADNLNAMAPGFEGEGSIFYVSNAATCPKKIRMLFTREHEIRFNFLEKREASPGESVVVTPKEFRTESRELYNVIECPDVKIEMPDKRIVLAGEYVPFSEMISAWKFLKDGTTVTIKRVREAFVQGGWFYAWTHVGDKDPLVDWNNRVSAIKNSYRQLFQINKHWMDKMYGLKARRVALINNATGTYAPSPVYQPYSIWMSERGAIAASTAGSLSKYEWIYNEDDFDGKIKTSKPCGPARLFLSDIELGILRVDFSFDPLRHYSAIFPSKVENAPTFKMGERGKPRFIDEKSKDGLSVTLSEDHKMSTIITASPAPNSDVELYVVEVSIEDLSKYPELRSLKAAIQGANGMPLDVRVSPTIQTARYAWDDDYSAEIDAFFGVGAPVKEPKPIDDLMVNKYVITEVAIKQASAVWAKYATRFKGSLTGPIARIRPKGTNSMISFISDSDGSTKCKVQLDNVISTPDFLSLLRPNIRAFLLQQVGT